MTDPNKGYVYPDKLVSTQWVADHLNDPKVRIVESNEDIMLYPRGHVPGAVQIDWIGDLNDPITRDYLNREQFEHLMARNGIANDTFVVFYGDKSNWWACYALWIFELFGHTNTAVMDGGRLKWEKEGRPLIKDVPAVPITAYHAPDRTDYKIRAFRDDVLKHIQVSLPLVDVRSPGEYSGQLFHMDGLSSGRLAAHRAHPRRGECAVGQGRKSGRRHIQDRRAVAPALRAGAGLEGVRQHHRLLPDRRTLQPHLVCAQVSAGLPERAEL